MKHLAVLVKHLPYPPMESNMKTYEVKIRETTELTVRVDAKSKAAASRYAFDNLYGSLIPDMKSEDYILRSVEEVTNGV